MAPPELRRRSLAIASAAGGVTGAVVAVVLITGGGVSAGSAGGPAERGAACRELLRAFDRERAGDERGFRIAAEQAASAAEKTLQVSGRLFGPPERASIELRHAIATGSRRDARIWLARGLAACARLERS